MNGPYQHSLYSKITPVALAIMLSSTIVASAKNKTVERPKNSQAKSYGSGWECTRGFKEVDRRCLEIKVPSNAYRTKSSYGPVWECKRGFKVKDDACVAIPVPTHGYLASYGERWKCHRGYRRVDDTCAAVVVPKNGYLADDSYGRGWTCERGFTASKTDCVAVNVPSNAHLGFSGTRWECDQPFIEKQGRCIEPNF